MHFPTIEFPPLFADELQEVAFSPLEHYNKIMNWNPLYPGDENISSLEEAIREAEWEDDMRQTEQEWGGKI